MIERIQINNFQSHKETVLEFHPGVNTIIGSSDSGKTAILRALRWAVWNRPLGDSFRSHWGGDTFVVLEMDDNRVVRFKGKGGDHYLLTDKDGGEIEFKAFGTDPPDEISQALSLSDVNLQNQHDNAFLISNNPGEVARHFNKVANIDKIDSSLRTVETWVRKIRQEVTAAEEELERHREELAGFEYLDKMEAQVEGLEQLEEQKIRLYNNHSKLEGLITQVEQTQDQIKSNSYLLPAETAVKDLLHLIEQLETKGVEYKQFKEYLTFIARVDEEISDLQAILIDESFVNSILELYNNIEVRKDKHDNLLELCQTINGLDKDIKNMNEKLKRLETEWHEEMPEVCPLCGK